MSAFAGMACTGDPARLGSGFARSRSDVHPAPVEAFLYSPAVSFPAPLWWSECLISAACCEYTLMVAALMATASSRARGKSGESVACLARQQRRMTAACLRCLVAA
ncbi:hypothetical protein ABPG77_003720 [Micractinium sp. CCAP 211/92]